MKKVLVVLLLLCLELSAKSILLSENSADSSDFSSFAEEFESEYKAVNDPLISYNRFMHKVNFGIYDYALNPVLNTYNATMPLGYRLGIRNFFDNLSTPLRFAVNILSFEFKDAMDELGRFVLNSSVGLLGIMDVASQNGLYTKDEDFGILFGKWGAGDGFYLVLPILGPSNLRDSLGLPLNSLANPTNYLDSTLASVSIGALNSLSKMANEKNAIDSIRAGALDDYILVRDAYTQRRNELIKGQ